MRAYLDTNLYISYLLKPSSESPPSSMIRAGIAGMFTMLVADPTLYEIIDRAASKPYLAERISRREVDDFIALLHVNAEYVQNPPKIIPAISRDRNDDYLITYSVASQADYLVTGDKDLLVLGEIEGVTIVTPAEFMELMHSDIDL